MFKKLKNIILRTDRFLYKKFGSDKSVKLLENIKEAKVIFSYLDEIGKESKVRFVGGCVRKSLCGENIDDIDLATSLEPDEVKKRLIKKDVRVTDTGIIHGTITAILNKKKFEITTLRKDVSTDGRHANVQFTLNWEEDALRRDFTINAIYADIEGRIFDPLNGISDLRNGKVKFIGSSKDRIQEDYLRILRYFRFFTQYSKTDHEQYIIKSIKENINGLNKISNERIFDELKKILSLKNLSNLFSNKQSKDIILNIFPQFKFCERLENFNNLNRKLRDLYTYKLILSLLIVDQTDNYEFFCYKYKVSNNIKNKFKNISKNFENLKSKKFYSRENIKKLIYFMDKDSVRDLLFFSLCLDDKIKNLDIKQLLDYISTCPVPQFPISGEYLKKYGYKSGINLGKKLKSLEEKWIENNFVLDQKVLEKMLNKIGQN
jgi:tRNA nucleotidyltransferase/poly(A) polymerase